jgi:hypothetical protein
MSSRVVVLANLTRALSRNNASNQSLIHLENTHTSYHLYRFIQSSSRVLADSNGSSRDDSNQGPVADDQSIVRSDNVEDTSPHGSIKCDKAFRGADKLRGATAAGKSEQRTTSQNGTSIARPGIPATPTTKIARGTAHDGAATEADARRATLSKTFSALRERYATRCSHAFFAWHDLIAN